MSVCIFSETGLDSSCIEAAATLLTCTAQGLVTMSGGGGVSQGSHGPGEAAVCFTPCFRGAELAACCWLLYVGLVRPGSYTQGAACCGASGAPGPTSSVPNISCMFGSLAS